MKSNPIGAQGTSGAYQPDDWTWLRQSPSLMKFLKDFAGWHHRPLELTDLVLWGMIPEDRAWQETHSSYFGLVKELHEKSIQRSAKSGKVTIDGITMSPSVAMVLAEAKRQSQGEVTIHDVGLAAAQYLARGATETWQTPPSLAAQSFAEVWCNRYEDDEDDLGVSLQELAKIAYPPTTWRTPEPSAVGPVPHADAPRSERIGRSEITRMRGAELGPPGEGIEQALRLLPKGAFQDLYNEVMIREDYRLGDVIQRVAGERGVNMSTEKVMSQLALQLQAFRGSRLSTSPGK